MIENACVWGGGGGEQYFVRVYSTGTSMHTGNTIWATFKLRFGSLVDQVWNLLHVEIHTYTAQVMTLREGVGWYNIIH